jgi:predicted ATP-grasp superfamily ATP-dependent carboligase
MPALDNSQQRRVAVIGADSPIGLTVIRELGARGLVVFAIGKTDHAIGRYSRYTQHFTAQTAPLAEWLPQFVAEHRIASVMAISEYQLVQLAVLKGKLGDCLVLCPDSDQLVSVLDKQRTLDVAAGLGVAVPSSWQPMPGADFAFQAEMLSYPVAIKWADPNAIAARLEALGLALEKVAYADNAAQLLGILVRYEALGAYPLVQSWCPGYGLGQMLHMHAGQATLRFQHRRLREWPPSGGFSSFCQAEPREKHREQMALSELLLQTLGWEGPAMVEYRHDPETGRYWLMEINGRFWGSIPLAWHCGAHFAWETWRCAMPGVPDEAVLPYRIRRARYAIPDVKHLAAVLRDHSLGRIVKLRSAARFLADFLDPGGRYFVWAWRDPLPFFGDMVGILRRIGRRGS